MLRNSCQMGLQSRYPRIEHLMDVVNLEVIVLAFESQCPPNQRRARTDLVRPSFHVWREYVEGDQLSTCTISGKQDMATKRSKQSSSGDQWADEAFLLDRFLKIVRGFATRTSGNQARLLGTVSRYKVQI